MTSATPTNSATVKFHKGLYAVEAIREAAATFADFAVFDFRSEGEHFVVDLTEINREVEGDVVAEFCNFALAHTAVRSKKSA